MIAIIYHICHISRTIMHGTQNLQNLKKAKLGESYHANNKYLLK